MRVEQQRPVLGAEFERLLKESKAQGESLTREKCYG
jgi:hypothetical protein